MLSSAASFSFSGSMTPPFARRRTVSASLRRAASMDLGLVPTSGAMRAQAPSKASPRALICSGL